MHPLLSATASGRPIFIARNGLEDAMQQLSQHLEGAKHHPGYELALFHAVDLRDMSMHGLRRSNREDAGERPYLISPAFLVGGPGDVRESARFQFGSIELVFHSGCDDIGCDIWSGEDTLIVQTRPALDVLKKSLVSCYLSQGDYDLLIEHQLPCQF